MTSNKPELPYYTVIFIANVNENNGEDYAEMDRKMSDLSTTMPGYLGSDFMAQDGKEMSVSYWKDEESIKNWHQNELHKIAQNLGKQKWFKSLRIRVAKVERDYGF